MRPHLITFLVFASAMLPRVSSGAPISFDFSITGFVVPLYPGTTTPNCVDLGLPFPACTQLTTPIAATMTPSEPGLPTWDFTTSNTTLTLPTGLPPAPAVGSGSWLAAEAGGGMNNNLSGSYVNRFFGLCSASDLTPLCDSVGASYPGYDAAAYGYATIDYTILAGTGVFTGLTGVGTSALIVRVGAPNLPADYVERGSLTVVPEPGSLVLLSLGLAGLLLRRRSR